MSYSGHPDQRYGHISYAQSGEDLLALNLLELLGVTKPSYLDVGAHHPFTISNTALMYERGCRGVNIEANPNLIRELKDRRPEDLTVNVGVGPTRGQSKLFMYDRHSGRNTLSKENAKPFEHRGVSFVAEPGPTVEVITLRNAVDSFCAGRFPDFLTIDVEGLDIEVMCSTDFVEDGPKVAVVEAIKPDPRIPELKRHMELSGYFCFGRVIAELFFVQERYREAVY